MSTNTAAWLLIILIVGGLPVGMLEYIWLTVLFHNALWGDILMWIELALGAIASRYLVERIDKEKHH